MGLRWLAFRTKEVQARRWVNCRVVHRREVHHSDGEQVLGLIEMATTCVDCRGQFFPEDGSPSTERCLYCATCVYCFEDLDEWELGRFCSGHCFLEFEASVADIADETARRVARAIVANEYKGETRLAMHERDGWVCYLCGEDIDRTARYPQALSAVLDHVIPVAKGGLSIEENLRTAHAHCNARKSDMDLDVFLSRLEPLVLPA